MSELVTDCPRCGAQHTTFDVSAANVIAVRHNWQHHYEAFSACRHCGLATVFHLIDAGIEERNEIAQSGGIVGFRGNISTYVRIDGYVSQKDAAATPPPEHLPDDIRAAFDEGATCAAVGCHNAAATMFRLCIDLATRPMLPDGDVQGLNAKTRRDLGLRLPWLFDNGRLPEALRELSHCVKEDGNDGAHAGTLQKEDADDLLDFTTALLERLYTEPERLKLAKARRDARRAS